MSHLALTLALISLGICAVGLVRGRLPEVSFTAGLVSLPLVAFALGSAVLMQRSQSPEFCGSCHVMGPLLASLSEDNGSLAATHYQAGAVPHDSACYTCHSGYGVSGDMAAKQAGMIHMLHEITGGYEFPLAMRGPFDLSSCNSCHADTQNFKDNPVHASIKQSLESGELGCTGACHPAAHPAAALSGEGF